ncbi:hypothetical protein ABZP36_031856 [Zizania latifolia]
MSTQSISAAAASAQYSYPSAAAATAAVPSYFPVPFHLQNVQQPAWPAAAAATDATPAYNAVHPVPQVPQVQVHQLFQKDSQIITPEALAAVKAAIVNSEKDNKIEANKKAVPRKAAGQTWEDPTLADWPESKISFLVSIPNCVRILWFYDIQNIELGSVTFLNSYCLNVCYPQGNKPSNIFNLQGDRGCDV